MTIESRGAQARRIFSEAGGRTITEICGPNQSTLRFYSLGGRIVILQIYADDLGWTHFVESEHVRIADLTAELFNLGREKK